MGDQSATKAVHVTTHGPVQHYGLVDVQHSVTLTPVVEPAGVDVTARTDFSESDSARHVRQTIVQPALAAAGAVAIGIALAETGPAVAIPAAAAAFSVGTASAHPTTRTASETAGSVTLQTGPVAAYLEVTPSDPRILTGELSISQAIPGTDIETSIGIGHNTEGRTSIYAETSYTVPVPAGAKQLTGTEMTPAQGMASTAFESDMAPQEAFISAPPAAADPAVVELRPKPVVELRSQQERQRADAESKRGTGWNKSFGVEIGRPSTNRKYRAADLLLSGAASALTSAATGAPVAVVVNGASETIVHNGLGKSRSASFTVTDGAGQQHNVRVRYREESIIHGLPEVWIYVDDKQVGHVKSSKTRHLDPVAKEALNAAKPGLEWLNGTDIHWRQVEKGRPKEMRLTAPSIPAPTTVPNASTPSIPAVEPYGSITGDAVPAVAEETPVSGRPPPKRKATTSRAKPSPKRSKTEDADAGAASSANASASTKGKRAHETEAGNSLEKAKRAGKPQAGNSKEKEQGRRGGSFGGGSFTPVLLRSRMPSSHRAASASDAVWNQFVPIQAKSACANASSASGYPPNAGSKSGGRGRPQQLQPPDNGGDPKRLLPTRRRVGGNSPPAANTSQYFMRNRPPAQSSTVDGGGGGDSSSHHSHSSQHQKQQPSPRSSYRRGESTGAHNKRSPNRTSSNRMASAADRSEGKDSKGKKPSKRGNAADGAGSRRKRRKTQDGDVAGDDAKPELTAEERAALADLMVPRRPPMGEDEFAFFVNHGREVARLVLDNEAKKYATQQLIVSVTTQAAKQSAAEVAKGTTQAAVLAALEEATKSALDAGFEAALEKVGGGAAKRAVTGIGKELVLVTTNTIMTEAAEGAGEQLVAQLAAKEAAANTLATAVPFVIDGAVAVYNICKEPHNAGHYCARAAGSSTGTWIGGAFCAPLGPFGVMVGAAIGGFVGGKLGGAAVGKTC